MSLINKPFTSNNGTTFRNRIVKAAMEEQLAGAGQQPDGRLETLYRRWGEGGAGLIITGHVMVDRRAMAQPGDVVLDERSELEPFRRWSAAAGPTEVWMQINHPGRLVPRDTAATALAPSAVPLDLGPLSKLYREPTAMSAEDIRTVIERFATTAELAESAGFGGVQIHAAHGYLLSQFLSPLVNRRNDQWGGSLADRARPLLETIAAVRGRVSAGFGIAVKLNSADFQRGGFELDDARQVVQWLSGAVDFVELSGGNIESLTSPDPGTDERTRAREAYLLDLAGRLVEESDVPLMLTGGIRRREAAERVLERGFALVGVATAIAQHPEIPHRWLAGEDAPVHPPRSRLRSKALAAAGVQAAITGRLQNLGRGKDTPPRPPALAFVLDRYRRSRHLARHRSERAAP